MNALSDFKLRLDKAQTSTSVKNPETIDVLIKEYESKILELKGLKKESVSSVKPKKARATAKKTSKANSKSTPANGTAQAKGEKK
jgi:hypothetical protein